METSSCVLPDFGAVVQRTRLVQVFRAQAPALTLVCAPAGYGKSVLAAQFARLPDFDHSMWIPIHDRAASGDEAVANLAGAVALAGPAEGRYPGAAGSAAPATKSDILLTLNAGFRALRGRSVCIVLDGAHLIRDIGVIQEVAVALREHTSSLSRVVVSCRQIESREPLDGGLTWVVEDSDLKFQPAEIEELLSLVCSEPVRAEKVKQLLQQSAGQPALASLLARHETPIGWNETPRDLVWYTERMVGQLSDVALGLLYEASLLQDGRVGDLSGHSGRADTSIEDLARAVPLLVVGTHEVAELASFRVHAVLGEVVGRIASTRLGEDAAALLRQGVLSSLDRRQDYARLAALLASRCTVAERIAWCEQRGSLLLRAAGATCMARCLEPVPPACIASNPRLLLLRSAMLRQAESLDEALESAELARRLAEVDENWPLIVEASLLIARLALDAGRLQQTRDALGHLDEAGDGRLAPSSQCLVQAYLALADAQMGDHVDAERRVARVRDVLRRVDASSEEGVFAANCVALIRGQCQGQWMEAAAVLSRLATRSSLPPTQRVLIRANCAAALLETGRVSEARELVDDVMSEIARSQLRHIKAYALGTRSSVLYAIGLPEAGLSAFRESRQLMADCDDVYGTAGESLYAAVNRRACGLCDDSLALAEQAEEILRAAGSSFRILHSLARIEIAASLLALGDVTGARVLAIEARGDVEDSPLAGNLLRADMVVAEADCRQGNVRQAVERLAPHADYVSSGSASWQVAMYVRAFPSLLGVLARAVGVTVLPLRMLRLIPEGDADAALACAVPLLPTGQHSQLADRLSRRPDRGATMALAGRPATTPCRVRLFGGLEVTTEFGTVDEDAWRKRKARILFAMLTVKRGQDVPRDIILEHLWPEMDAARARNNFYVIWSAMKRALAGGEAGTAANRYVQNTGGLCRVSRAVRSDLDEFEDTVAGLRSADASHDASALLEAARTLMEIYRGELLPGDLYDDWFAEVRDRTRHDFCDAMMRAARVAESRGEHDHALVFLRRATLADPWREDVYQTTMRCQMNAGQRSNAIETYLACRSKLVDDLGLDPSAETTRLYEALLAMEGGEPPAPTGFHHYPYAV